MANLYILTRNVRDNKFGVGRAKFILDPPLLGSEEEIISTLNDCLKKKFTLTLKCNVTDEQDGTTTEDSTVEAKLYGYHSEKPKVVEMHKEVMQQLTQQQRKVREAKAAKEAADRLERERLEIEQSEAAKKVEREKLAELERGKGQPVHSSPNVLSFKNPSLFASRPLSFNMEGSIGDEVDYSSSDFTITDESSNQSGPEASNSNNKRPYHVVELSEPGSSMTAFLNSSEITVVSPGEGSVETPEAKIQRLELELFVLQNVAEENDKFRQQLKQRDTMSADDVLAKKISDCVMERLKEEFMAGNIFATSSRSSSRASTNSSLPANTMVPLSDSYPNGLKISLDNLSTVVNAGHVPGYDGVDTKRVLPDFVNRLLESVYSKTYMATHSLTGNECPALKKKKTAKKKTAGHVSADGQSTIAQPSTSSAQPEEAAKDPSVKDEYPPEDIAVIIHYVTTCWNQWYKRALDPYAIRKCITNKSSTCARWYKGHLDKQQASPAASASKAASSVPPETAAQ